MLFVFHAYSSRNEKPTYLDPIFANIYHVQCVLEPPQCVPSTKFSSTQLEGRMTCSSSLSVSKRHAHKVAFCMEIRSSFPQPHILKTEDSNTHCLGIPDSQDSSSPFPTSHPCHPYLIDACLLSVPVPSFLTFRCNGF